MMFRGYKKLEASEGSDRAMEYAILGSWSETLFRFLLEWTSMNRRFTAEKVL